MIFFTTVFTKRWLPTATWLWFVTSRYFGTTVKSGVFIRPRSSRTSCSWRIGTRFPSWWYHPTTRYAMVRRVTTGRNAWATWTPWPGGGLNGHITVSVDENRSLTAMERKMGCISVWSFGTSSRGTCKHEMPFRIYGPSLKRWCHPSVWHHLISNKFVLIHRGLNLFLMWYTCMFLIHDFYDLPTIRDEWFNFSTWFCWSIHRTEKILMFRSQTSMEKEDVPDLPLISSDVSIFFHIFPYFSIFPHGLQGIVPLKASMFDDSQLHPGEERDPTTDPGADGAVHESLAGRLWGEALTRCALRTAPGEVLPDLLQHHCTTWAIFRFDPISLVLWWLFFSPVESSNENHSSITIQSSISLISN